MPVIAAALPGLLISFLTNAIVSFVGNFILGAITNALSKKPQALTPTLRDRTVTVRQPITAWQVIYGEARVGGAYVFIHTTGSSNDTLHAIIVLACHECESVETIYFGSDEVPLDADGNAIGKYAQHVTIKVHLGSPGQVADADLIAAAPDKWTSDHRLAGRCYIYCKLVYDQDLFPNLPNISARVKGKKLYDPRDGVTRWSSNPILAIRDYLTTPAASFGVGATSAEIDDSQTSAEANICDEEIAVIVGQDTFVIGPAVNFTAKMAVDKVVKVVGGGEHDRTQTIHITQAFTLDDDSQSLNTGDQVLLSGSSLPTGVSAGVIYYVIRKNSVEVNDSNAQNKPTFQLATSLADAQAGTAITLSSDGSGSMIRVGILVLAGTSLGRVNTGDKVQVSSTGTLPSPLAAATDYWWIRRSASEGKLAATFDDALAGTAIAIADTGSGTHTVTRNSETRYTCNGVLDTSNTPADIIQSLLSSCAGKVVRSGGLWRLFVASWRAPTVPALTKSDAAGPIQVQTLVSRRDLFNGVKGVYVSPDNFDQPTDFPPYPDPSRSELDAYLAQDGGERIWKDIELTYTNSPSMAQRLAKIVLEQIRQQITVQFPAKLTAWGVTLPDVQPLTLDRYGWVNKPFEVIDWKFSLKPGPEGVPVPGIDLVLRETASAVYDWNSGLETASDPAANTNLPDPFTLAAPGTPAVSEELYASQTGAGVKNRAIVSYSPPDDVFASQYQVAYGIDAGDATVYIERAWTTALTVNIDDLQAGIYRFHVRCMNTLGIRSPWSPSVIKQLMGLTAKPANVATFSVTALGGQAHCRWDRATDLDVLIGGWVRLRWTPDTVTPSWANAMDLGPQLTGSATEAAVPLVAGTYMAKFVDSTGNESENEASAIVTAADLLGIATVLTVDESGGGFAGTKTSSVVIGGSLRIDSAALIDDWVDIDSILDWDTEGGVASAGSYNFASKIDLGYVFTFRLTASIATQVFNAVDLIDKRTGNIDTWESIDGLVQDAVAGCRLELRTTNDDPNGVSPAWSAWQPFVVGDYVARGVDLRLVLYTSDVTYNVAVSSLAVTVSLPQRTYEAIGLAVSSGGTAIAHSPRFWQTPAITVNIKNAASGDYPVWSGESAAGATLTINDATNTGVNRTVDLIVKGLGAGS